MAVAALICGILSVFLSWIPSFSVCQIAGLVCGVLAIVMGLMARRRAQEEMRPQGLALAGQIVGFVGTGLCVMVFASCQYCSYKMGKAFEGAKEELEKAAKNAKWDGGLEPAPASRPTVHDGLTLCTEVSEGRCLDPGRRFYPDTEMIHAVYVRPQGTAWDADAGGSGGRRYMVVWIAEAVSGGALQPGTSLGTSTGRLYGTGPRAIKGTLARPGKRWPTGRYKVAVTVDGRLVKTRRFRIAEEDDDDDTGVDDAGP